MPVVHAGGTGDRLAHQVGNECAPDTAGETPAFIGRDRELSLTVDALTHGSSLILIEGEAGIGKTRLLRESLRAASMPESGTVEAVCPPLREPFPLGAMVTALSRCGEHAAPLSLSPLAGALHPLFPEWRRDLPPPLEPLDDPRATRHRLFRALAELLARLEASVLVVEDAHWADAATLEFLLMLAASGHPRISLVVTYRPTDVPPDSSLWRLTSHAPAPLHLVRLTLEPLNLLETRAMVASMFATGRVAEEFIAFLHEHTQGIPLALEESLWLLRDRGDIFRADGQWSRRALDQLQVPPTVRDSVLERIAWMEPAGRRVLEAAAVLAEPADEQVLGAVAGLEPAETRHGLANALTRGLLREANPARFEVRHPLAARALVEAVPISERRRLHHRAGRALQRMENPSMARLSRHFREAGDLPAWRHCAEAGADLALASGDDRAAVESLHELLTAAQKPPGTRTRLARKLGEAAVGGVAALGELAGQVADTLRAVVARGGAPGADRGQIRLLLGRLLLQLGEFDEAYEQLQAAVVDLADRPALAAQAMMSLSFPRGNNWPADRHLEWLERATGLLAQVPAQDRQSLAVDRASALLMLGEPAGWVAAEEIGTDATTLHGRRQVARSLMNSGHMAIAWGRYDHARQRLATAEDLMRATGYERLLNSARLTRAYLDWHTGAWTGLAARIGEVVDAEDTLPEAHLEARLILALLDLAAGRRAERELREVLTAAAHRGMIDIQMVPAAALGRLHLAAGEVAEAVQVTRSGIDMIIRKDLWLWATDIAPVHTAALAQAGRLDPAEKLVRRFHAGVADRPAPAPAAALELCRAVVAEAQGTAREAAQRAAGAAQRWSALPRPYDELLALERQGNCLLAAGDHERATQVLTSTQQRLWTLGARWDADRLAHQLRRHGVEVIRAWRGGRRGYGDQLSPRELEVVRLVASGRTNRQVAETLFLSPRTVDRHLSKAMHKLAVSSRTTLAVVAADAGLLGDDDTA